uniref:Reverse transcriptase N-terminal domain-containing protein n=1 Tax=Polysiphonia sertularioides TaxID=945028 RepID=A0A1Z1M8R1_9FLOR|nr:hypothetical protein [Polysiphonia sertularioides]ARW62468.1 hypothetical protein [Polysiphonia sertularioides]
MKKKNLVFKANSKWLNLPWNKISLRISMLTKQIFLEIKKYNLSYVHILQNYLLNSSELKVLVIDRILSQIYFLFYKCKKDLSYGVDKLKTSIVLGELNKKIYDKRITNILTRYLREQIIVICIKPIFEAKLINCSGLYNYLDTLKQYENYFHCIKNSFFLNKITVCLYFKKSINKLLDEINCLDINKIYLPEFNTKLTLYQQNSNFVNILNRKVIENDIKWYNFFSVKQENYLKTENTSNYNIIDDHLKLFWLQITRRLQKTSHNNLKISNQYKQLLNKIIHIYYLNLLNSFLNIDVLKRYHKSINQMIGYIKRKSNTLLKSRFKLNHNLNKMIYINNLKKVHPLFQ